ncbi:MAG: amidohydrolase [Candidatus Aminicenantes bacterium]|nr:amidohydrolase [Candidatus Aminicenantes bacterium]
MVDEIKKEAAALSGRLVEWRRNFHRRPETAFREVETSAVLRAYFEGLGMTVKPMAGTGLRADLQGLPGGRTVALRADMDALPLAEEGDKPCLSENPGACHACGHDGHMAVLMGAAEILARRKGEFRGRVVFLGQPSEELPPGGAAPMIEEGALEGVDSIFGLHFWQPLPTGTIGLIAGPVMAQADNFRITVTGRGGHGSMPQSAADPILAAGQIIVALQSVVSRNVDPLKPAVLSFGTVSGGTVYNIIPNEVKLSGTVRTFDPDIQALMKRRLAEIAEATGQALGVRAFVEYEDGYPPLVNPPDSVEFVRRRVEALWGSGAVVPFRPVMGGEDFALYLKNIPGAFLFFGSGDGMPHPHHHPRFDLDERALAPAAALMASLALSFLAGQP